MVTHDAKSLSAKTAGRIRNVAGALRSSLRTATFLTSAVIAAGLATTTMTRAQDMSWVRTETGMVGGGVIDAGPIEARVRAEIEIAAETADERAGTGLLRAESVSPVGGLRVFSPAAGFIIEGEHDGLQRMVMQDVLLGVAPDSTVALLAADVDPTQPVGSIDRIDISPRMLRLTQGILPEAGDRLHVDGISMEDSVAAAMFAPLRMIITQLGMDGVSASVFIEAGDGGEEAGRQDLAFEILLGDGDSTMIRAIGRAEVAMLDEAMILDGLHIEIHEDEGYRTRRENGSLPGPLRQSAAASAAVSALFFSEGVRITSATTAGRVMGSFLANGTPVQILIPSGSAINMNDITGLALFEQADISNI